MEVIVFLFLVLVVIYGLIANLIKLFQWIETKLKSKNPQEPPITNDIDLEPIKVEPKIEHSEAYKQFLIKHMMEVVQIRLQQETKKLIEIPYPVTEEDKVKLKELYDRSLAKYS